MSSLAFARPVPELALRDAGPTDAAILADIKKTCLLEQPEAACMSRRSVDRLYYAPDMAQAYSCGLSAPSPTSHALVATYGRQIVGFCLTTTAVAQDYGNAAKALKPYRVDVDSLYVLPDHQNGGIGRRLLESMLDRLGELREKAFIRVSAGIPAERLYRRYAGEIVRVPAHSMADWLYLGFDKSPA